MNQTRISMREEKIDADFEQFWALYPRRVAKRDAQQAWARMNPANRFEAIRVLPAHVSYWIAAGTDKQFLPYPATWLNGRRWEDELEMPNPLGEWWKTTAGIEARAAQLGMQAKPGEGYHELKARILEAQRR